VQRSVRPVCRTSRQSQGEMGVKCVFSGRSGSAPSGQPPHQARHLYHQACCHFLQPTTAQLPQTVTSGRSSIFCGRDILRRLMIPPARMQSGA
jgi:hypothetical protein